MGYQYYCVIPRSIITLSILGCIVGYCIFFSLQPKLWPISPSILSQCTIIEKTDTRFEDSYAVNINVTLLLLDQRYIDALVENVCISYTSDIRDKCSQQFIINSTYPCYYDDQTLKIKFKIEVDEDESRLTSLCTSIMFAIMICISLFVFLGTIMNGYKETKNPKQTLLYFVRPFTQLLNKSNDDYKLNPKEEISEEQIPKLVKQGLKKSTPVWHLLSSTSKNLNEELQMCWKPTLKSLFTMRQKLILITDITIVIAAIIIPLILYTPKYSNVFSLIISALIPVVVVFIVYRIYSWIEYFTVEYCLTLDRAIILSRTIFQGYKIQFYWYSDIRNVIGESNTISIVLKEKAYKTTLFNAVTDTNQVIDFLRSKIQFDDEVTLLDHPIGGDKEDVELEENHV